MKPAYQTVIFDIDGTLLKSDRGVMNALKYTTEKMGVPYPSAEIRQKFIGPPLHYNFHDLMGMNEADTARAIDLFNEYYLPIGVFESELYPESWSWSPAFSIRERGCASPRRNPNRWLTGWWLILG